MVLSTFVSMSTSVRTKLSHELDAEAVASNLSPSPFVLSCKAEPEAYLKQKREGMAEVRCCCGRSPQPLSAREGLMRRLIDGLCAEAETEETLLFPHLGHLLRRHHDRYHHYHSSCLISSVIACDASLSSSTQAHKIPGQKQPSVEPQRATDRRHADFVIAP